MLDAGELQAAYNGAVRMHIECPKHTKFMIPQGWTTTMTNSDNSTPREVVTNRYVNVHPIGEDNYQNCCGTIKGQGPPDNLGHIMGCCKHEVEEKKARMKAAVQARPEIVAPPLYIKQARKTYLNHVKKTVVPQIKNTMLSVTHANNETKMHTAIPTECKAWSAMGWGPKRKMPGQCQPGVACNRRCKMIPCVAILLGMSEEREAREAYAAEVQEGGGL